MNTLRMVLIALLTLLLISCTEKPRTGAELVVLELPSGENSLAPNFARTPGGDILLSWLETNGEVSRLVFSRWSEGVWSPTRTIAQGQNWFVNWADFPAMLALDENRLVAHWLVRSGPGTYAYDVHTGRSSDGGKTWRALGPVHDDNTETEHGFVAFYPHLDDAGERQAALVWLDGRKMQAHAGDRHDSDISEGMTLRHARLHADGSRSEEIELDALACDCCQTAAAAVGDEVLVAYRDRSESEIRDIRILRRTSGAWQDHGYVNEDGWEIPGCPVNGPALVADDRKVAIAWFTAADGQPVVKAGFSTDGGQAFTTREIARGDVLGRVDVALLSESVAVTWLASAAQGAAIYLQLLSFDGRPLGDPLPLIGTEASRGSGFPQLVSHGDELLLAWTRVEGKTRRVHAARVVLSSR